MKKLRSFIGILLIFSILNANFSMFCTAKSYKKVFSKNIETSVKKEDENLSSNENKIEEISKKQNYKNISENDVENDNNTSKPIKTYKVIKIFAKGTEKTLYLVKCGKNYGISDRAGNLLIPCEYDSITQSLSLIITEKNTKLGAYKIYYPDNQLLPPIYDEIKQTGGNIVVKKDGKFGLFSVEGQQILPVEYDNINIYIKDKCILQKDKKFYYYNIESKKLSLLPYDKVKTDVGNVIVEKNGKYGFINPDNKSFLLPLKYDNIEYCVNKYCATLNGKKGLYNFEGKEVLKPIYKDIKYIEYNYYLAKRQNDKFDLFHSLYKENKPIEIVSNADEISAKDKWLDDEENKYISVKKDGKWGIIAFGKNGKVKTELPFEYDEIGKHFCYYNSKTQNQSSVLCIYKQGKAALYNIKTHSFETDFYYEDIDKLGRTKYFKVKQNGKYALFDYEKQRFSKFEYEDIRVGKFETEYFGENIEVKKHGVWHYKNPAAIAGQCSGYGVFYIFCIATLPVTLPVGVMIIGLCIWSCYSPPEKIPEDLPSLIQEKNK